ncbi:hypothetical protein [Bacillus sp. AK031]
MMRFTEEDQAIIEQALKAASANTADYQEITQYQKVLEKFQTSINKDGTAMHDGFRYDYDDASDV